VNGVRATYYARAAGSLNVSARIVRPRVGAGPDAKSDPITLTIPIQKNSELSVATNLAGEVVLMAITFAVALVTSLPAVYFSKPTFGTYGDYTAILAWAIGVDQGKDLIQMLSAFKAPPSTGSTS
jgi:hypothetical protein